MHEQSNRQAKDVVSKTCERMEMKFKHAGAPRALRLPTLTHAYGQAVLDKITPHSQNSHIDFTHYYLSFSSV